MIIKVTGPGDGVTFTVTASYVTVTVTSHIDRD